MREKLGTGGFGFLSRAAGSTAAGTAPTKPAPNRMSATCSSRPKPAARLHHRRSRHLLVHQRRQKNKDLAFAFIKAFNTKDIVSALHSGEIRTRPRASTRPRRRQFKSQQFLLDSTKSP